MTRRLPQVAAVVFAVLFVGALLMVPPLPGLDSSGDAVVAHVVAHASALRLQALFVALGSLALVTVLAYARDRLDGPAGYVVTIGSAAIITEFAIESWFTAGLALHADHLNPATARTLADIATMWGPLLTVADVMVAVPIALASLQQRMFPRWVGALAAIFALEQLIETVDHHWRSRIHPARWNDESLCRRTAFHRVLSGAGPHIHRARGPNRLTLSA